MAGKEIDKCQHVNKLRMCYLLLFGGASHMIGTYNHMISSLRPVGEALVPSLPPVLQAHEF
jgi:hypothetical protein